MTATKKHTTPATRTPAAPPAPPAPTVDVTQQTLDETPSRLLGLLRGIGTRPEIQAAMRAVGYDDAEHEQGWSLLEACSGRPRGAATGTPVNRDVTDAIAALDAADERAFALAAATLKHRAPAAHAALLDGLHPGRGGESVVFFKGFLERLGALDGNRLAGVSASESRTASQVLAKRGLDAKWRSDTAALVTRAETLTGDVGDGGAAREALNGALRAARAFYDEWAQIARQQVKRKDYLIVLGLAARKKPAKAASSAGAAAGGASTTATDAGAKASG